MATVARCPACSAEVRVPRVTRCATTTCPTCSRRLVIHPPGQAQTDPFLGRKFAHYQIGKKIGVGPLASVYRAKNVRLHRTVALKIMSDRVSREAPHLIDHLVDAARSAAGLEHPNVLATYFVGKIDGRLFIEMQYAEEGSVRDLLRRNGRLPPDAAVKIIRDAAKGLAAVHKKGLLHHGIHPQNLMCMRTGVVKLADIGIRAHTHDEMAPSTHAFAARELLYVAPERLTGGTVDQRSDIYSLGATLFALLTGHPPFDAPSRGELLRMLVQESVPSPHDHVPTTPASLCKITRRMLDKNPRHRPANCEEVIRELNGFLEATQLQPTVHPQHDGAVDAALAEPVLSDLILSDRELGAAAPPTADELKAQCGKMLRHARARRLRKSLVYAATRLVAAAAVLGLLYGAHLGVGKIRALIHARRQRIAVEERTQQAAQAARTGNDLDMRGSWRLAAENYSRSLDLHESPEVRERLEIVREVEEGFALAEANKWGEAERVLKTVLPKARSKGEITRCLRRIDRGKSYAAAYTKGQHAYKKQEWQEALRFLSQAADLADDLRIKSNAAELAGNVKKRLAIRDLRKSRMLGLLDTCKAKGNAYAFLVACQYYLASQDHVPHHDSLRTSLEQAQLALASSKKDDPPRADETVSSVTLRRGGTIRGTVRERSEKSIVIEVETDGEARRRVFHPSDVVRIEPIIPHEANVRRAEGLYADLVEAQKAPRPFEVLTKIGRLRADFGDVSFVANADEQKAKYGTTFSELVSWAVPPCEVMCPDCESTGQVTCPDCEGKKTQRVRCKHCENMARLPICPKCRGSGLRLFGACSVCGGSGKIHCKRCNAKGCDVCSGKGKWTCRACAGKGRVLSTKRCATCGGTGKLAGKTCPKCYGKGKPVCLECKGRGRQTCPVCKGERWVTVPCTTCGKTGRVECPTCKGTGKKSSP